MSIQSNRKSYDLSGRKLKRARKIYFRLIRKSVTEDETGLILQLCAERMVGSGMYAKQACLPASHRHVRYSILRAMYRFDVIEGKTWSDSWHFWLQKHNWESWHWVKKTEEANAI